MVDGEYLVEAEEMRERHLKEGHSATSTVTGYLMSSL